ncbi:MAG: M20 family metallopeptidase [Planctomycetes bacterium]|nr:M20 family metallopeptidase [Planctomycetota bacterium]
MEVAKLLQDLVRLPSVNPMGRDLPEEITLEHRVTAYLEGFFRDLGVPWERQTIALGRDNIVARCDVPGATRTIMLEAHQDTVPIDNMIIEPFGAKIENGRLYGRGACDIKGGMACMLWAFARVVKDKPRGAANVIMACSVDEEHTFQGVKVLAGKGPKADFAVVAEPTQLNIVHAHKGVVRWNVTTTGRSCHSSSPERGVNAVYRMGRVLQAIERYAEHLRGTRVDPLLGPATLSVGMIAGGTSVNTVPDRCRIEVDRRVVAGEDPDKAPDELMAYLKDKGNLDFAVECERPWMSKGALSPKLSGELTKLLGNAINSVVGKHEVQVVPYGTDASTLADAGIPSVVFGPGDIACAHTKDEWVPLDEVEKAGEILYRLACST